MSSTEPQKMVRRELKRRAITLEQKLHVIEEIESNPQESRASVADRLGIPVTTLKSIYLKKDEIRRYAAEAGPSGSKRSRSQNGMYSALEKVLFEWFREQRDSNIPVSGALLKEKALEMAREMNIAHDFKASSGWVDKFRKRHGIVGRGNAVEYASFDIETDKLWMDGRLPDLTVNYKPCDIYNLGETGLCLDLPNKLAGAKSELDKEIIRRRRKKMSRLTALVGANADGSDKLTPLLIGAESDSRCFEAMHTLPIEYACDPKAWMTSTLFKIHLEKLNNRMRQEGRHIIVFVDTCPAHPPDFQLSHVQVLFFPPNCSSRVQPLHLGIIAALKIRYRKLLVQRALATLQHENQTLSSQISIIEAMHFVAAAWHDIPPDSIAKCFRLAGIGSATDGKIEPPTQADESCLYGDTLPLHVQMDIGETPNDWHKISDRINYADFICQNDEISVCAGPPEMKTETLSGSDSDEDEPTEDPAEGARRGDRIPTFVEALRGYEVAARYITSKEVSSKDMAVVADFARILYQANAAEEELADSPDS